MSAASSHMLIISLYLFAGCSSTAVCVYLLRERTPGSIDCANTRHHQTLWLLLFFTLPHLNMFSIYLGLLPCVLNDWYAPIGRNRRAPFIFCLLFSLRLLGWCWPLVPFAFVAATFYFYLAGACKQLAASRGSSKLSSSLTGAHGIDDLINQQCGATVRPSPIEFDSIR